MSDDNNVVNFTGLTYGKVPVRQVLEAAIEADLEEVIIIGKYPIDDKDSRVDYYFAASGGTNGEVLWDVEQFKYFLTQS